MSSSSGAPEIKADGAGPWPKSGKRPRREALRQVSPTSVSIDYPLGSEALLDRRIEISAQGIVPGDGSPLRVTEIIERMAAGGMQYPPVIPDDHILRLPLVDVGVALV